jgi:hypothetical protein
MTVRRPASAVRFPVLRAGRTAVRALRCGAVWGLTGLALLAASAGEAWEGQTGRTVRDGIAVELAVEPVERGGERTELREGDHAAVRFTIRDTTTGTPVAGAYPAAWMDLVAAGGKVGPAECVSKVQELLGGSLFAKPDVDLNAYYVLALNQDATITVVDPLFGFGGTKLLALVQLPSPGEDWVLSPDRERLFVSLPDSDRVAVVDTSSWKIVAELAAGPRPGRLVLQPDGAYLWVALDGPSPASGVAVFDARNLVPAARIPTGPGRHEIALASDSRHVFVSNSEAGTVSVLDVAKLARIGDVEVGSPLVSMAYSPLADAAYAAGESGTITAVGVAGGKPEIRARFQAGPGLGELRFAPGGRLGFVPSPRGKRVYIFDTAQNRVLQTAVVLDGPDQVTFSNELAYVRHRGSEIVLMIPLDELGREGAPVPVVDFPGGEHPFGKVSRPSRGDSIVRAPGANAVLVANPADKAIYYYKEGMAAPMGTFRNYGREPRAVLVLDRSLKERQPGVYSTVTRLAGPGRYQVAFFLDSPRLVHCFDLAVAPDPVLEEKRRREAPAAVQLLLEPGRTFRMGETVRLRYRLTDPHTGQPKEGLDDVRVFILLAPGMWNERYPMRPAGDGVYELDFAPPAAGTYLMSVECPSQRLLLNRSPQSALVVAEGLAPASR